MGDYEYDNWLFITLDSFPTVGQCVQAIATYAPSYGGTKQKDHVHEFCKQILEVWQKTVKFISLTNMNNHLKYYACKVQKAKGSRRVNMKNWYNDSNKLFDLCIC